MCRLQSEIKWIWDVKRKHFLSNASSLFKSRTNKIVKEYYKISFRSAFVQKTDTNIHPNDRFGKAERKVIVSSVSKSLSKALCPEGYEASHLYRLHKCFQHQETIFTLSLHAFVNRSYVQQEADHQYSLKIMGRRKVSYNIFIYFDWNYDINS